MEIRKGFDEKDRAIAAKLYVEAFKRKFEKLWGEEAVIQMIFEEGFNPQYCLCAYDDNDGLVGIAGFHEGDKGLIDLEVKDFIKAFGWLKGFAKACVTGVILHRKAKSREELLMDGIAVNRSCRGQGVGTLLFDALIQMGIEKNFKTLKLDVIDENPKAKALYERLGFQKTAYQKMPKFISNLIGVSGVTSMVRNL